MVLAGVALGLASPVLGAAIPIGGPLGGDNLSGQPGVELTATKIFSILNGFACWTARIAVTLILAALAVYALQFFFSRGNPSAVQSANRAFWLGIVGIIVIFGAYTIIATVAYSVGAKSSPYPILCD